MFERLGARPGAFLLATALVVGACASTSSATIVNWTEPPSASTPAKASPSAGAGDATCAVTMVGPAYQAQYCQLQLPSLAANLLGEPGILNFYVLTPADYETSGLRYPSVYFLAGYTDDASGTAGLLGTSARSDKTPSGSIPPIVVAVSGKNVFGGAMYANSSVSGNWEDAISRDLIGYVDANYRTLAVPASRGLTGHSMGGAGAINLAFRHPELFGVLYAMSPAIFDSIDAQNVVGQSGASRMLDLADEMASVPAAERAGKLRDAAAADGNAAFALAYGTAFAPDPASPILMKYPYKRVDGQIVRDEAVWPSWDAGWGNVAEKVQQYEANLKQYRAIGVDYGTADEIPFIPGGSHLFATLLQGAGIEVTEATFAGGHTNQFADRFLNYTMPFMAEHLASR